VLGSFLIDDLEQFSTKPLANFQRVSLRMQQSQETPISIICTLCVDYSSCRIPLYQNPVDPVASFSKIALE